MPTDPEAAAAMELSEDDVALLLRIQSLDGYRRVLDEVVAAVACIVAARDVIHGAEPARRDALDEVERRINAARNEHWQQHLRDHPLADGSSCPRDYGIHDAFARSVGIVRAVRGDAEEAQQEDHRLMSPPLPSGCTCGWKPALGESRWRAFDKHLLDVRTPAQPVRTTEVMAAMAERVVEIDAPRVILCATPEGCTCGALANMPAGMHHCDCAVHPGWCGQAGCLPCEQNGRLTVWEASTPPAQEQTR